MSGGISDPLGAIFGQWGQGAGPSIFGSSTPLDLLSGIAGAGALMTGNAAVGLPLLAPLLGGLGGSSGTGGTNAATAATGAGTQQGGLAQQLNQIAPATQSIMNAMGLNPQNRPQTATAPQTGLQQPPSTGRQAQAFNLPQMQQPVQAAGAMSNVPAGAGTAMAGTGQNQSIQQILAAMGYPVRSYA